MTKKNGGRPQYSPTLEEIDEECRKIRSEWSREKWRNQDGAVPWDIPRALHPDFKLNKPT